MVWGFMYDNSVLTSFFGSEPNSEFLKRILDYYAGRREGVYSDLYKNSPINNPIVTKIFELEYSETFRKDGKYHLLEKGSEIYLVIISVTLVIIKKQIIWNIFLIILGITLRVIEEYMCYEICSKNIVSCYVWQPSQQKKNR